MKESLLLRLLGHTAKLFEETNDCTAIPQQSLIHNEMGKGIK